MIKLDSYSDKNVFENAKKYISENLKQGDFYSTSILQRTFSIGYNKACRVLEMLHNEKIIQLDPQRIKPAIVL